MVTCIRTIRVIGLLLTLLAPVASALEPDKQFFQYRFEHPPEGAGVPDEIFDAVQDSAGFLWLATNRGLARYDGMQTTLWRLSEHPGVLSNQPRRLFVDSRGRLLVASPRGLALVQSGDARALWSSDNVAGASIRAFAEDSAGTVWVGGERGLMRLTDEGVMPVASAASIGAVHALMWRDGKLFVGGHGEITVIEADRVQSVPLPAGFDDEPVRDFADFRGQLWAATHKGPVVLHGATLLPAEQDALAGIAMDTLLVDRDETLWFGGARSVGRVFADGRVEVPDVYDESSGFAPQLVRLLEDAHGTQWHVSRFFGLTGLSDSALRRTSYTEGLPSVKVLAVAPDPSRPSLYVATDAGLSVLQGNTITLLSDELPGADGEHLAMVMREDDQLVLGTDDGLFAFQSDLGQWVALLGAENPVRVRAIARGRDDSLWIASDGEIRQLNIAGLSTVVPVDGISVTSVFEEDEGTLWLGAVDRIATLEGGRLRWRDEGISQPLGTVTAFAQTPTGTLLATTADHGIHVHRDGQWIRIDERNGLPPERVIDIEVDARGVWMVTTGGVFFAALDEIDALDQGLRVRPVATMARYRSPVPAHCCRGVGAHAAAMLDGVLFASTDDGLLAVDSEQALAGGDGRIATPYLLELSVDDQAPLALNDSPGAAMEDSLRLPPNARRIEITYSAIAITDAEQVRFRYRLRGLSDTWVDNGVGRKAVFQDLPPGDYVFELQASSSADRWSKSVQGPPLYREAAFVETAVARVLAWIGAVGSGLLLIWLRLAGSRRQQQRLERTILERTQTLNNLNESLRESNEQLQQATRTDPLTGLVNRRAFDAASSPPLAQRAPTTGLLILIDIDHFKRINDTYGHSAGDEVLRQFAMVLRGASRESDIVSRWGGEEFLLLFHCAAGMDTALLDRICARVREHAFRMPGGEVLRITCSVGSVRYPLHMQESIDKRFDQLLELADSALYAVKEQGRDGWALLAPTDASERPGEAVARIELSEALRSGSMRWTASREKILAPVPDGKAA